MNLFFFSDTHGNHGKVLIPKETDIAVFCGDCSSHSNPAINSGEVYRFLEWYKNWDCIKVMIAGNHDSSIEKKLIKSGNIGKLGIIYIEHGSKTIEGINFFGSPYTPSFSKEHGAFTYKRNRGDAYWNVIPDDCDVLVTHGPPKSYLDLNCRAVKKTSEPIEMTGCKALMNHVHRVKPKIHAFGHIHEQVGRKLIHKDITYLNCCQFDHTQKENFNGHLESFITG